MPFELVIAEGPAGARGFRFDGREVTIGRAAENDLVVHDPWASRVHARIRERGEGYAVLDDGSCNGTVLNERPVRGAARLRDGDRIRVGGTTLEFASRRRPLVLVRAIITEKSMTGTNSGRYTFAVAKAATKQEIAQAVAQSFKVDVVAVNTSTVHGKTRRVGKKIGKQSDWKKAVVTLAEGQRIERYFVEGV